MPSYDGRNKEPVTLPCKIPLLLMLGADGIAVGLATRILPHNFTELLEAQIAILQKKPFKVLPDFQQGGLMDVSRVRQGQRQGQGARGHRASARLAGHPRGPLRHHHRVAHRVHRGRGPQEEDQDPLHPGLHGGKGRDPDPAAAGRGRRHRDPGPLRLHPVRGERQQQPRGHPRQPPGADERGGDPAHHHPPGRPAASKPSWSWTTRSSSTSCTTRPWSRSSSRTASTSASRSARPTNEAVQKAVLTASTSSATCCAAT
jgi:hypothetical protein